MSWRVYPCRRARPSLEHGAASGATPGRRRARLPVLCSHSHRACGQLGRGLRRLCRAGEPARVCVLEHKEEKRSTDRKVDFVPGNRECFNPVRKCCTEICASLSYMIVFLCILFFSLTYFCYTQSEGQHRSKRKSVRSCQPLCTFYR